MSSKAPPIDSRLPASALPNATRGEGAAQVKSRRFTVDVNALPPKSGFIRLDSPVGATSPGRNKPARSRSVIAPSSRQNSILDLPLSPLYNRGRRRAPTGQAPHDLESPSGAHSAEPVQWDAHVFRLRRREAQLALQNLPKYAALVRAEMLRNASKAAAESADAQLKIELTSLDDEFFAEACKFVEFRVRARAFEMWRAIAKAKLLKSRSNPLGKLGKPPSFSSKLELLAAQQKPRIETRVSFRKFKNPSRESSSVALRETSKQTPSEPSSPDPFSTLHDESRPGAPTTSSTVATTLPSDPSLQTFYSASANSDQPRPKSHKKHNKPPGACIVS